MVAGGDKYRFLGIKSGSEMIPAAKLAAINRDLARLAENADLRAEDNKSSARAKNKDVFKVDGKATLQEMRVEIARLAQEDVARGAVDSIACSESSIRQGGDNPACEGYFANPAATLKASVAAYKDLITFLVNRAKAKAAPAK